MQRIKFRKDYASPRELFPSVCRGEKMWGLYLAARDAAEEGLREALPYLTSHQVECLASEGFLVLLFSQEDELSRAFSLTPSAQQLNASNLESISSSGVYALTCDPAGKLINDNTPPVEAFPERPQPSEQENGEDGLEPLQFAA